MYVRHGQPFTDRLLFDMFKRAPSPTFRDTNEGDVSFRFYVLVQLRDLPVDGAPPAAALLWWLRRREEDDRKSDAVFLVVSVLFAFALFSVMLTDSYILPAVPPAMLTGVLLDQHARPRCPDGTRTGRAASRRGSSRPLPGQG